mgnify:FL=1
MKKQPKNNQKANKQPKNSQKQSKPTTTKLQKSVVPQQKSKQINLPKSNNGVMNDKKLQKSIKVVNETNISKMYQPINDNYISQQKQSNPNMDSNDMIKVMKTSNTNMKKIIKLMSDMNIVVSNDSVDTLTELLSKNMTKIMNYLMKNKDMSLSQKKSVVKSIIFVLTNDSDNTKLKDFTAYNLFLKNVLSKNITSMKDYQNVMNGSLSVKSSPVSQPTSPRNFTLN